MNNTGSIAKPIIKSPLKIPQKSTGIIGQAMGNTQAPSTDTKQYGMSMMPPPSTSQGTNPGILQSKMPTAQPPAPSTAVKKQTNVDGSTIEYHAPKQLPADDASNKYNTATGKENPNYKDPNVSTPTNKPVKAATPTPQSSPTTYGGVVGNLANQSSSPYNQTASSNIGLLSSTTADNEKYAARAKEIADSAGQTMSDIGRQGARAGAGYRTTGTSPVAEGNAAVIAQTTAAQQQAVAQGANMELSGNAQGLQAQGQQQSGYASAAGQALAGQSTAQSALGSAAGYLQPTSNIILRDPTTGAVIGDQNLENLAAQQGKLSGIQSGASSAASALGGSQAVLTQAYQQGQAQLRAADGIESQIAQTLISNPTLNNTPITALTDLNRWFSGQTSQPEQQALAKQVASYIAALGMSPEEATQIASQKGGTIGTLLKTLKDIAITKNEANNPANVTVPGSTSSGGSSNIEFNSNGTLKAVSF